MKGGVGKTTIASQLAHAAVQKRQKVLAVDLDPQSNLSQAVMGIYKYAGHLRDNRPTIAQIFEGYIPAGGGSGSPSPIDLDEVIVRINGLLDLIPSRLELSRTLKNPTGKERRLAKALSRISDRYDLILIDCAPTESILTDAAYFASRYVIVPVKPEFMATIGLPLLARSIRDFRLENEDHEIEIAGLVFNYSSTYSDGPEGQQSVKEVREEAQRHDWDIFATQIRYSASYPRSARAGTSLDATPNARQGVKKEFKEFSEEVFGKLNIRIRR